MRLVREESVVRAICSDKIDPVNGKIATSLFKGREISLSRLAIIPLARQWPLLAATVQKLPGRKLEKLGELTVADVEDIGATYRQTEMPPPAPTILTVEDQPIAQNPAHAIIPQEIKADGLAKALRARVVVHELPAGFDPTTVAPLRQ
jgi:hypothetical protein